MRKHVFVIQLIFASFVAFAQRTATTTQDFTSNIEKLLLNPKTGIVYVKEDTKLSAYSNIDNKVIWEIGEKEIGTKSNLKKLVEFDLSDIDKDSDVLELVEDSDYIFANINGRDLIIDGFSGYVVFNSEKILPNAIILKQIFLPYEDSFGFIVLENKKFILKYFDLTQGKILWETPLGNEAGFKSAFSKGQSTRVDRIESFNQNFYALINNNLFSLDKLNGKVKWSLPEINQFYVCQNDKNLVIVKNKGGMMSSKKLFNLIESSNGKSIWKNDVETANLLKLEDWGDKVLVAHSNGFNMYYYADGGKYWKKDVKGSNFKQVISLGDDFLYISDKNMILVDKQGMDKWKKDIEISDNPNDEIHHLGLTKSGKIMYITATYGNMVDYNTGVKLWKRNIKFNESLPLLYSYDQQKDVFLIYNDEYLYKFDPNVNDKPEPFAKIKAKSDKTMSGIEVFDWGVSLTSQSEVIGIGLDGNMIFQNKYEQPGEGGRQALKVAGMVGSAYLGTRSSAQSIVANSTIGMTYRDESGKTHTSVHYLVSENRRNELNQRANANAGRAAATAALTQNVAKRFNALKQNSNFAYIFAKDNTKNSKNKVLVKVSKKDGKEIDKVIVDDLKPLYEVDAVTETLFYGNGKKLMVFEP